MRASSAPEGHTKCCMVLLDRGADANLQNNVSVI